jgi:hypothetical protein
MRCVRGFGDFEIESQTDKRTFSWGFARISCVAHSAETKLQNDFEAQTQMANA